MRKPDVEARPIRRPVVGWLPCFGTQDSSSRQLQRRTLVLGRWVGLRLVSQSRAKTGLGIVAPASGSVPSRFRRSEWI